MKGQGIMLVGEEEMTTNNDGDGVTSKLVKSSCREHCTKEGGENLQVQAIVDAIRLEDGRKIDIRSHILIANVKDPLVVFVGAELVRICVEPIYEGYIPEPYPGMPTNSKWNPFQQVCNVGRGEHPMWSYSKNIGPLEMGIPSKQMRLRIINKMNQINLALVKLLHKRWSGEIGMFQVLAIDYLVDVKEKVWLLEVNDNPGFPGIDNLGKTYPNPWGDIFDIEWTILKTYNEYYKSTGETTTTTGGTAFVSRGNNNNSRDGGGGDLSNRRSSSDDDGRNNNNPRSTTTTTSWERILQQRLSTLDLDTMRMMIPKPLL